MRARGWSYRITVDSRTPRQLVPWLCSGFIWTFWIILMMLAQPLRSYGEDLHDLSVLVLQVQLCAE